jgi:hypothetical protein
MAFTISARAACPYTAMARSSSNRVFVADVLTHRLGHNARAPHDDTARPVSDIRSSHGRHQDARSAGSWRNPFLQAAYGPFS